MADVHDNPNSRRGGDWADTAMPYGESPPGSSVGSANPMHDPLAEVGERETARWIHLGTLIAVLIAIFSSGIGFPVPLLVTIILWLATKEKSPFVDDHGREALNFQISVIALSFLLLVGSVFTCGASLVLLIPLQVVNLIALIIASVQAGKGNYYRYPVCLRFIKCPGQA